MTTGFLSCSEGVSDSLRVEFSLRAQLRDGRLRIHVLIVFVDTKPACLLALHNNCPIPNTNANNHHHVTANLLHYHDFPQVNIITCFYNDYHHVATRFGRYVSL